VVADDGSAKVHYLDASAMVKLIANDPEEEPGRAVLRAFFFSDGPHRTTSYCLAETLSALKGKWRRRVVDQDEYVRTVREFFRLVWTSCEVEDVPLAPDVQREAERLMRTYQLDFIDSIQLVTVLHGRFAGLVRGSKSVFITADRALAAAGRSEGVRVWECTTEPCLT
jgi:predicted nucleic acid-binding protein